MKSSKQNKYFSPEIEIEVTVRKDILFPERQTSNSTSTSINCHKKSNLTHQKISSANNQSSRYKFHNQFHRSQYLNPFSNLNLKAQNQTQRNDTIQTPEINSRFKLQLEKLNTSISSLNNKYSDLIKQHFKDKQMINNYKIRFIKLKKTDDKIKSKQKKEEYLNLKKIQKKQNHEKMQKMKDDYNKSKKKELDKKAKDVKKLKIQEQTNLKKYQNSIKMTQMEKKRIKEEEKKCIEDGLIEQNNIKKNEIENRKIIQKEKEQKNAELMQKKQIDALIQKKINLEAKIKVQENINEKTRKQYCDSFNNKLNKDILKIKRK